MFVDIHGVQIILPIALGCVVVSYQTATQFKRAKDLNICHFACNYLFKILAIVIVYVIYKCIYFPLL